MRKKNFLMLLGLAGLGLTAQAQVIATLGFEDGDQFYHHKDSAQFADFYGDHINLQPGDVWNDFFTGGMRNAKRLILVRMPWRRTIPIRYRGRNGSVV